jgi:shikimate kinase
MKLILINGLIASGKTTLGTALVQSYSVSGKKASFYDLDDEIERLNGNHEFDTEEKKTEVWHTARKNIAEKIGKEHIHDDYVVVAGPFYMDDEISGLTDYLPEHITPILFTLDVPLEMRKIRNSQREHPNDVKDLEIQEEVLQQLASIPGIIVENNEDIDKGVKEIMIQVEKE